jgi:hypothetical protein
MANMSGDTITPQTLRVMEMPRCNMPDVMSIESEEASNLSRWGISKLKYYVAARDNDMEAELWDKTIRAALDSISAVCNLEFTQTSSPSQANIIYGIGRGKADDFDGSSGTLAWMQLPPSSNYGGQLSGKFDSDERWLGLNQSGPGIRLLNVVAHETEHACGLSHTNVPNSLINPFYSETIATPQTEDIRQLVMRYGKPVITPPTKPDNPPVEPKPEQVVITINGNIRGIDIPGYRIFKAS